MDHINGSGFFPGTSTTLTQTGSNIRNLLLTNKGERVGQPEFGCGLLQVLFEPMSDDLLESVRSEIEESIAFWLPHVTINNLYGLLVAVETGAGLAALPDYMVQHKAHLVKVLPEIEGPSYEVHMVYHENLKGSSKLIAFRDFLATKIKQWRF